MNMIYGIYFRTKARFLWMERCLSVHQKDSFNLGIGMVHQHFKLVDILTAAENIVLGLPGRQKVFWI